MGLEWQNARLYRTGKFKPFCGNDTVNLAFHSVRDGSFLTADPQKKQVKLKRGTMKEKILILLLIGPFLGPSIASDFNEVADEVIQANPFELVVQERDQKEFNDAKTELLQYLMEYASGETLQKLKHTLAQRDPHKKPVPFDGDCNKYLAFAIILNCEKTADYLTDLGFHLRDDGSISSIPMAAAIMAGHLRLIQYYYDMGCSPGGFKGEHPVEVLLQFQDHVLTNGTKHGDPDLIKAIRQRFRSCLSYLLEISEPFDCENYKKNPLAYTVKNHWFDEMEALLRAGYPVNTCKEAEDSMPSIVFNTLDPNVLTRFLELGMDPNAEDSLGRTVLQTLSPRNFPKDATYEYFVENQAAELIDILLFYGLDLNHKTPKGETLLDFAASYYDPRLCELLIAKGATFEADASSGRTPYHLAAIHEKMDTLALLADYFPEGIQIQDHDGNTPLHYAVRTGNEDAIPFLIQHGANPFTRNKNGETPLDFAKKNENLKDKLDLLYESNTSD